MPKCWTKVDIFKQKICTYSEKYSQNSQSVLSNVLNSLRNIGKISLIVDEVHLHRISQTIDGVFRAWTVLLRS